METIIALIIMGIWGSIVLVGKILVKLERTKASCWAYLNDMYDFEEIEEREEN